MERAGLSRTVRILCESGLSETDAAVVGRHFPVRPDHVRRRAQEIVEVLQQQLVLEDAAREDHGADPVRRAELYDAVADALRQTPMKGARDGGEVLATAAGLDHRCESATEIELAVYEGKGKGLSWWASAGELLEPDRRLSLEGHLAGEAQQGRHGIEQAASRGRRERPQALGDQLPRLEVTLGKQEGRRGEVRQAVQSGEESRGRLHRMLGGRIAAWQHGRAQMPHALESCEQ